MVNDRSQQPIVPDERPASGSEDDDFRLATSEDFDGALRALEDFDNSDELWEPTAAAEVIEDVAPIVPLVDEPVAELVEQDVSPSDAPPAEPLPLDSDVSSDRALYRPRPVPPPAGIEDEDRLRVPRAQGFRRRLRNQLGLLPLTLWLLALGAYLLARGQEVDNLPDYGSETLAIASVLVGGFTALFHAILSGRRERGLLFLGLWVLVTAALIAGLVALVDDAPDAAEWWPLLLVSLGITQFLVFALDRGHDSRLLLTGLLILVAGGTAYAVTSGEVDQSVLDQAGDYWPLLLAVVGIGLLPLAVGRRLE